MAKPDTHIPNLITQVQADDDVDYDDPYYSGGISARRDPGEEYVGYESQPSFFERICCCFSSSAGGPEPDASAPIAEGHQDALLPPQSAALKGRKCLILDLDETLVHSSFKPITTADFIIPVEIEDQVHQVYVSKRPGVDDFMKAMGEHFEIVVFTASLAKYADPVLDLLDIHKVVHHRLFREHCTFSRGNYVKDLSRVGRKLKHTLIIDNSAASYMFHPEYAIGIGSWFDDMTDEELTELTPFLIELSKVDDVRVPLAKWAKGEV
mmetsp:Transcript_12288/g.49302  ORF Transcript_12288/g.49302 Transcript_12288/m.49302 type:complete len:266 (-) Transcript_12288:26-823(-)